MITLKTLELATAQEVADQIATHLLTQMERSTSTGVDGRVYCAYRGNEGLKCAAGCLIAEDEYISGMERVDWKYLIMIGCATSEHCELITRFQRIHDNVLPFNWGIAIRGVYRSLGLDTSKVKHLILEGVTY